jgi:hypothetical protein
MMPDKTFDHSAEQTDRQFLASNPRASDNLPAAVQSEELQRELMDLRQQTAEVATLRQALETERRRYREVLNYRRMPTC